MKLEIHQKQSQSLLEEHAKFSYNLSFLGRNELFISIVFLLIGVLISIFYQINRIIGLPFIAIGIFNIIRYPTVEKRWVKKKVKEKIFDKNIIFEIIGNSIRVTYDKVVKTHKFNEMRECLVSETGILFKISFQEYYFISFTSFDTKIIHEETFSHLKNEFAKGKLKIKRKYNSV